MQSSNNSRRRFLSSLAILSAGTVVAGSPTKLFSEDKHQPDLQQSWKLFVSNNAGREMLFAETPENAAATATPGHAAKTGRMLYFEKANLLVQPTWIYWQKDADKPADLLVHIHENKAPYKRLITLNRYEVEALVKTADKAAEENLLHAATIKNKHAAQPAIFAARTNIRKNKQTTEITYHKNNHLFINEKIIFHA